MAVADVRSLIGSDMLLGVFRTNCRSGYQGTDSGGLTNLGVGAVFPTGSKNDADEVSHETLKDDM